MDAKRIVIKVGTSTLTYENGKINYRRVDRLCKVIADLENSGKEIIFVSSGAVAVGVGKLGMKKRPTDIRKKQAAASVGQCELMFMYDKFFGEYNTTVSQVLLTRPVMEDPHKKKNVINTFFTLIEMGIIPIVNENDTVAIDELEGNNFGDNDMLSALVAKVTQADLLVILTDIDGLYDCNPKKNPQAKLISYVPFIDDKLKEAAGDSVSNRGTGGMITKLAAAEIAVNAGIPTVVMNGSNPKKLYDLFDGKKAGTYFDAVKNSEGK